MRDLSRIFQGCMRAPRDVVKTDKIMVSLWRNECSRVFGDKLSTKEDKKRFNKKLVDVTDQAFGKGKYSKRRRSNVAVIIVRKVFIGSFLFYCLLLNHSFQTNPNSITNCFKLFSLFTTLQLHCSCVAF